MNRKAESNVEQEIRRRFALLCRMTGDYLSNMSPQQRDRMMQVHLAQARGATHNGDLLRDMTDAILMMRAGLIMPEEGGG